MNKLHLVILGVILYMIISKLMKSQTEKLTSTDDRLFSKSLKYGETEENFTGAVIWGIASKDQPSGGVESGVEDSVIDDPTKQINSLNELILENTGKKDVDKKNFEYKKYRYDGETVDCSQMLTKTDINGNKDIDPIAGYRKKCYLIPDKTKTTTLNDIFNPNTIAVKKKIKSEAIAGTSPCIPLSGFNFRVIALRL